MKNRIFWLLTTAFLLQACSHKMEQQHTLTSIQITDKNGLKQTISHEERLKGFERIDFHQPQPYEKVVRSYMDPMSKRDYAKITTYHPNGHVHQSLDVVGGRACGFYHEWYANGEKKVEVTVIEGPGDVSAASQLNWVFDGLCKAYDKHGNVAAEIYYDKGLLTGNSLYFFPDGTLKRSVPFTSGYAHGDEVIFNKKGEIIKERQYQLGQLHGKTFCNGSSEEPKYSEYYQSGLLQEGLYHDLEGEIIYKVVEGQGQRPIFEDGRLIRLETITDGAVKGRVTLFDKQGHVHNVYHVKDNKKEGAEWVYFPGEGEKPKLYIEWQNDVMCGMARSYYESGAVESEREMVDNNKQGILSAYYEDGTLKMMETYDKNQLISGQYMKKGEAEPASRVENGTGTAIFFDEMGQEKLRLSYEKGKVLVDQER